MTPRPDGHRRHGPDRHRTEGARASRAMILLLTLFTAAAPFAFAAKPKPPLYGCTVEQVRSPEAAACIERLKQDIIDKKPANKVHFLMCKGNEMFCCTGTKALSCELVEPVGKREAVGDGVRDMAPPAAPPPEPGRNVPAPAPLPAP